MMMVDRFIKYVGVHSGFWLGRGPTCALTHVAHDAMRRVRVAAIVIATIVCKVAKVKV